MAMERGRTILLIVVALATCAQGSPLGCLFEKCGGWQKSMEGGPKCSSVLNCITPARIEIASECGLSGGVPSDLGAVETIAQVKGEACTQAVEKMNACVGNAGGCSELGACLIGRLAPKLSTGRRWSHDAWQDTAEEYGAQDVWDQYGQEAIDAAQGIEVGQEATQVAEKVDVHPCWDDTGQDFFSEQIVPTTLQQLDKFFPGASSTPGVTQAGGNIVLNGTVPITIAFTETRSSSDTAQQSRRSQDEHCFDVGEDDERTEDCLEYDKDSSKCDQPSTTITPTSQCCACGGGERDLVGHKNFNKTVEFNFEIKSGASLAVQYQDQTVSGCIQLASRSGKNKKNNQKLGKAAKGWTKATKGRVPCDEMCASVSSNGKVTASCDGGFSTTDTMVGQLVADKLGTEASSDHSYGVKVVVKPDGTTLVEAYGRVDAEIVFADQEILSLDLDYEVSNTVIVEGMKLVKNPNPETLESTGKAILKVFDAKAEACVLGACMPLSPKSVWKKFNSSSVAKPILAATLTCTALVLFVASFYTK